MKMKMSTRRSMQVAIYERCGHKRRTDEARSPLEPACVLCFRMDSFWEKNLEVRAPKLQTGGAREHK